MNTVARIITLACELTRQGVPADEAFNIAADRVSTTPQARQRAEKLFCRLYNRAQRND